MNVILYVDFQIRVKQYFSYKIRSYLFSEFVDENIV